MAAPKAIGQSIANFARDGVFPGDEEISKSYVEGEALALALQAVTAARSALEDEIRKTSRDSAPEVDTWIKNAHALQEDIENSKALAEGIARDAEGGDALQQAAKEDADHVEFLEKEVEYSNQLKEALNGIQAVQRMLDEAEGAGVEGRLLDALNILAQSWEKMEHIPAHEITRPLSVLNERAFLVKKHIHEQFGHIWNTLVHFNEEMTSLTIDKTLDGPTDIPQSVLIMKAYKEDDKRIQKFCDDFETAIVHPRVLLGHEPLKSISVEGTSIRASGDVPASLGIRELFVDLEKMIRFLSENFPPDFAQPLSSVLMPKLTTLIRETWLDSAVPVSLDRMTDFRNAIALVHEFAETITSLGWGGADNLNDWVESSPRLWVAKRRETALDSTRRQLSKGIGRTKGVERTETQTITEIIEEEVPAEISSKGKDEVKREDDWDAEWSDDEGKGNEDSAPGGDDKGKTKENNAGVSDSEGNTASSSSLGRDSPNEENNWTAGVLKDAAPDDDDDGADAWGWGDEDDGDSPAETEEEPARAPEEPEKSEPQARREVQREVTLTEKYTVSSMPEPVFDTIKNIIEDGVTLTRENHDTNPVSAAAVGLFGLPTLVLAMYRASAPVYYNLASGGNMYCYNDAMHLSDLLKDFSAAWSERTDLGPRAKGKVRLDGEVQSLLKFSRAAYGREMSIQRTIITDLLGGAQSFLNQGDDAATDQVAVESVVAHIRALAAEWRDILSESAWSQAVGALLSTVARKMIRDVTDLTVLGADEAFRVASLIALVTKLDDLFTPEGADDDPENPPVPTTSHYAAFWLKLHFLSEVLQSNLRDLMFLWSKSDLSLYFGAEEVVDLIELSFETNHRTRQAIAEIRSEPFPRGVAPEEM
ncbi:hypothetical protein V495_04438 [Pseudogymnoascus sp. VKM F-4514 (FW-929)]|nr:hypothetical protein V495_04438 [Pseudogymnoascus sp. VKM F-4514 (FW-929)]KFY59891.1 hypothetical protein V497_04018 [Pseudogymnoascus sp. VKM F-4516 (FW-969)]